MPDASGLASGGATHAWMQAYLAGAGWIDFCPTKQHHRQPQISFVSVLRWAPKHVLPLWGTYEGSPGSFFGMDVTVNVTEVAG